MAVLQFRHMRRPALHLIAGLFGFTLPIQQAAAHPHEFVTMAVQANFNVNDQLSGLTYTWTFDEFFTAYAIEGEDANKNGKAEPEELRKLLNHILGNIKSIDYFTAFGNSGAQPELATARPLESVMKGRQLQISFQLPFKKPLTLGKQSLKFAIYDDEFYIAMNHDEKSLERIIPASMEGCSADLSFPDPDDELVAFASSLGKEESSGGGLGASFAEWMSISCK